MVRVRSEEGTRGLKAGQFGGGGGAAVLDERGLMPECFLGGAMEWAGVFPWEILKQRLETG